MPNHVDNDLTIRGSNKDIKAFLKAVKSKDKIISAEKIIPYPKHFADADAAAAKYRKKNSSWNDGPKDGYNNGGYEWCCETWGTKWGLYDFNELTWTKTGAKVSFFSAWSPAIPLFIKMAEMFPSLTFTVRYYEQGAAFQGKFKAKGSEVLANEDWEYRGNRGG